MKRSKLLLASLSFVLASFVPILFTGPAQAAQTQPLRCFAQDTGKLTCDLAVDKQVSINSSSFVEADSVGTAANTYVGDTVTWKIIVSNVGGLEPQGIVYVKDVLPTGVTYVSDVASSGTYMHNCGGCLFENYWILPTLSGSGPFTTTLPATLTITTKASNVGLFENIATLDKDDPNNQCNGGCAYVDADPSNNSNNAWVNIQAKPQVLGASTTAPPQVLGLTNTGSGTIESAAAALIIIVTLAFSVQGRQTRKITHYKV